MAWLNLIIGFIAGGSARYAVTRLFQHTFTGSVFPVGTFVVNLTGCLLIGLFDTLAEERLHIGPHARLLLMTGFCGAYTTFSTFILETSSLFRHGHISLGLGYVLSSVVLGLVVFEAGVLLARTV